MYRRLQPAARNASATRTVSASAGGAEPGAEPRFRSTMAFIRVPPQRSRQPNVRGRRVRRSGCRPLDDADEHHHDRDDEQDVDEPAHGVRLTIPSSQRISRITKIVQSMDSPFWRARRAPLRRRLGCLGSAVETGGAIGVPWKRAISGRESTIANDPRASQCTFYSRARGDTVTGHFRRAATMEPWTPGTGGAGWALPFLAGVAAGACSAWPCSGRSTPALTTPASPPSSQGQRPAGGGRAGHHGQLPAAPRRHAGLAEPAQRRRPVQPQPAVPAAPLREPRRAAPRDRCWARTAVHAAAVRLHGVLRPARAAGGGRLPRPPRRRSGAGLVHHVFAYDWRRDLVESARRLDETLEALADARGDRDRPLQHHRPQHGRPRRALLPPLRDRGAETGAPVTWAGARRIQQPDPGGGAQRAAASTRSRRCSTATASASPTRRWPRR